MTKLEQLLSFFRKQLSSKSIELSLQALQQMQISQDPYHDLTHIERMLADLESFLTTSPEAKQINPEVLVLSISWHDTWKSGRLAKNAVELLHHQWLDGLGSAALFDQASHQIKLPKELKEQVSYAIRKHAQFQFLPVATEDAHLLRDLDDLDLWSIERLRRGESLYPFAAAWRIKLFKHTIEKQFLHTAWARQQKQKRHAAFSTQIDDLLSRRSRSLS